MIPTTKVMLVSTFPFFSITLENIGRIIFHKNEKLEKNITFSFLETCLIDGMLMSFCPKNSHRLMINVEKSIRNIKENLNWTEVSSTVLFLDSNEGIRHLQDAINSHLVFSTKYPSRIWMATKEVLTARKLKDVFRRKKISTNLIG